MKKRIIITLLLAGFFIVCCDDDKDFKQPFNTAVEQTFTYMFPQAEDVHWERSEGYYIAKFILWTNRVEAWFDEEGKWNRTITYIDY